MIRCANPIVLKMKKGEKKERIHIQRTHTIALQTTNTWQMMRRHVQVIWATVFLCVFESSIDCRQQHRQMTAHVHSNQPELTNAMPRQRQ